MGAAPALRGFAAGHGKSRRAPNGEARGPFAKFGSALGFRGLEENRVLTAAPVGHCPRRLDEASAAATGIGRRGLALQGPWPVEPARPRLVTRLQGRGG